MKKLFYFIPAAVYSVTSIYCVFTGITRSSPYWIIWPLVLLLAGFLLSKGYIRGAVLGLLPSVQWLSTGLAGKKTIGQLLPMGLIYNKEIITLDLIFGISGTVFYLISAFILYKKKHSQNERENQHE